MHTFNNGQWRVQNLMNNLSFLGNIWLLLNELTIKF